LKAKHPTSPGEKDELQKTFEELLQFVQHSPREKFYESMEGLLPGQDPLKIRKEMLNPSDRRALLVILAKERALWVKEHPSEGETFGFQEGVEILATSLSKEIEKEVEADRFNPYQALYLKSELQGLREALSANLQTNIPDYASEIQEQL